jgi:uncharacterized protein (DUF2062 family)
MLKKIKNSLNSFYQEFVQIKDSPQRIAIAFGMGVFLGILPFTGVVAAVALAWTFRLSKPAAVLGSLITNTWLSFVVFGLAVKMSGWVLGASGNELESKFQELIKNFQWQSLTDIYVLKIIGAIALGFFIVSLLFGVLAYGLCLAVIYWQRRS